MNRQTDHRCLCGAVVVCIIATMTACGGSQPAADDSANRPSNAASAPGEATGRRNEPWKPSIRTAVMPSDPCGWISATEVEKLMGRLAGPPRNEDGCRYTLVMPESVAAKRQQAIAMRTKMRETFRQAFRKPSTEPEEPERPNPILDTESDPRTYAVIVKVDVNGPAAGNAENADGTIVGDGWDEARRGAYRFTGRAGHVWVTVAGQAPDVPRQAIPVLAARVRDRIPDLPFAVTNPHQVIQRGDGDPCSLLTRAEAEAVLGPLGIEPYRASSQWPPFAHGQGHACAYFTPGHHVFVLSPEWEGGAQSFKIEQGIGGLVAAVAGQESLVIKGPWDQANVGMSGQLLFLKGDRLLQVHYLTSRATRGDAVRLAAMAMQRLVP